MKNVLLTTTALVAFAGAASAVEVDLAWSGSAEAGYNQTVSTDTDSDYFGEPVGFYAMADANLDVTLSQELNNGAVASLAFGSFVDWTNGGLWLVATPSWVAKVDTSYGSLSFGDVDNVNDGAFAEVSGMTVNAVDAADAFGAADHGSANPGGVIGLRAETSLGGFALAASTDQAGTDTAVNVTGSAGSVDFGVYYETTVMGATASTEVSGLALDFAYASHTNGDTSVGVAVGYSITSAISASGSYVSNNGVSQVDVGVAYAANGISASADYDVTGSVLDLGAGYTMEVQPGMTVTLGLTVDDATGTAVIGYTADVAYIKGDLAMYAGIDDASNMYAGVSVDLGNNASAYAYTADVLDSGPLDWADGARAGIMFTF